MSPGLETAWATRKTMKKRRRRLRYRRKNTGGNGIYKEASEKKSQLLDAALSACDPNTWRQRQEDHATNLRAPWSTH